MEYKLDRKRNLLYIKEDNKWIKYCYTSLLISIFDKQITFFYCKKTFFNLCGFMDFF